MKIANFILHYPVKAIELAQKEGQRIYSINSSNYETIIPQLQLAPAAITDIRGAAQAGLTITTHQKRISINGYTGEGYIILNERGTGAYMINGGLYGAILILKLISKALGLIGLMLAGPSDTWQRVARKINVTLGGVASVVDKLLHCKKGLNQALSMLLTVFLYTASFIVVTIFATGGVFLVTLGITVIVSLLNYSIMDSINRTCGYK